MTSKNERDEVKPQKKEGEGGKHKVKKYPENN